MALKAWQLSRPGRVQTPRLGIPLETLTPFPSQLLHLQNCFLGLSLECHCCSPVPRKQHWDSLVGAGPALLSCLWWHRSDSSLVLPPCQVDFTSCTGLFCVLGIVMTVTGIVTAIVLSFKYVSVSGELGSVNPVLREDFLSFFSFY